MSWVIAISFIIIVIFFAIVLFLIKSQTHILYSTDNCIMYTKPWPHRISIIWKEQGIMIKTSFLESTYLGLVVADLKKKTKHSSLLSSKEYANYNQALKKLFEEFIFAVSHRGYAHWGEYFSLERKNHHVEKYISYYNELAGNNDDYQRDKISE